MAGTMTPYIVRQGDYLAKLAFVKGFDADAVWNDAKNDELRSLRSDPNMLAPGDVLYIPVPAPPTDVLAVQSGTENQYSAAVPKTIVRLGFTREGAPLANVSCTVQGLGDDQQATTDGSGTLELEVPVVIRELQLVFSDGVSYAVRVGDLDPISETSGITQRLQHLGYYPPEDEFSSVFLSDPQIALASAVRLFQLDQSIDPSGTVDDATRQALVQAHGC